MGLYYQDNLDDFGHRRTIFKCSDCYSHFFTSSDIISDNFHGKNGTAYLVEKVVNVKRGPTEIRSMMTGEYTVCDTLCQQCSKYIGWEYLTADEISEKYKEGKHVIEVCGLGASGMDKKKELLF